MGYHIFTIDHKLRRTLQELQAFLGVVFNQDEIELIFTDAENDQVSYKTYTVYRHSNWLFGDWPIKGIVSWKSMSTKPLFSKSKEEQVNARDSRPSSASQ